MEQCSVYGWLHQIMYGLFEIMKFYRIKVNRVKIMHKFLVNEPKIVL